MCTVHHPQKIIYSTALHNCDTFHETWYKCKPSSDDVQSTRTDTPRTLFTAGLEKSSVLPVLGRFLKLKTDLSLDKKLKKTVHKTLKVLVRYGVLTCSHYRKRLFTYMHRCPGSTSGNPGVVSLPFSANCSRQEGHHE